MIEFIIGTLVGVLIGGFVFKMYDYCFHEMIQKKFEEEQLNKE